MVGGLGALSLKIMRRPIIQLFFGVVGSSNPFLTHSTSARSLTPFQIMDLVVPTIPECNITQEEEKRWFRPIRVGEVNLGFKKEVINFYIGRYDSIHIDPSHLIWESREGGNIVVIGRSWLHHQESHQEMAWDDMLIPSLKT